MSRSAEFDGSRLESLNTFQPPVYKEASINASQLGLIGTETSVPLSQMQSFWNEEWQDYNNGLIGEHRIHPKHIAFGGPDAYIQHLTEDIKKNGIQEPIELLHHSSRSLSDAEIIDGHHRAVAALNLGMKNIPVTWIERST